MRPSADAGTVYLCREPVDFRKSISGLAVLVEQALGLDPFAKALYVFTNRDRDRIKLLYWERCGFCLWYKRLERQRFVWPQHLQGPTVSPRSHPGAASHPRALRLHRLRSGASACTAAGSADP